MSRRGLIFGTNGTSAASALAVAAAVMLVPANLIPVIRTSTGGVDRSDTIFSGVVELWSHHLGVIAVIVFGASMVIPVLKLAGLGWLIFSVRRGGTRDRRKLTHLYAAIDFIGRWSMLDVFLVAFLTGLVQFGEFSTVEARGGIVAFAAAVILTVLATQAFNPHILWPEPAKCPADEPIP